MVAVEIQNDTPYIKISDMKYLRIIILFDIQMDIYKVQQLMMEIMQVTSLVTLNIYDNPVKCFASGYPSQN